MCKHITNQENKITKLKYRLSKLDESITLHFGKLKIDHHVMCDTHLHKNLELQSRFEKGHGLNTLGNEKSEKAFVNASELHKKNNGNGITLITQGAISESIGEVYKLFKFVAPKILEKDYMESFDKFMMTFAKPSQEQGGLIEFKDFNKVDELSKLYNSIAHVVDDKAIRESINLPEIDLKFLKLPPTQEQIDFSYDIINAKEENNTSLITEDSQHIEDQNINALIHRIERKTSLDMRLHDSQRYKEYGNNENAKINKFANKIARLYFDDQKYNKDNGTQFVFCNEYKNKDFNLLAELKKTLVQKYHIPKDEIRSINNLKTPKAKIVMGDPQKLNAQTNVPRHVSACHILNIPDTSKDLIQTANKILKPSNESAKTYLHQKIPVYLYGAERTLDAVNYQMMQSKNVFSTQIQNNAVKMQNGQGDLVDTAKGAYRCFEQIKAELNGNKTMIAYNRAHAKKNEISATKKALERDIKNIKSHGYHTHKKTDIKTHLTDQKNALKKVTDKYNDLMTKINNLTPLVNAARKKIKTQNKNRITYSSLVRENTSYQEKINSNEKKGVAL